MIRLKSLLCLLLVAGALAACAAGRAPAPATQADLEWRHPREGSGRD